MRHMCHPGRGGTTSRHAPGSEKGSSSLPAGSAPYSSRTPRTIPRWTRADDLGVAVRRLQQRAPGEPHGGGVLRLLLGPEAEVVEQLDDVGPARRPAWSAPRRGSGRGRGPTPRRRRRRRLAGEGLDRLIAAARAAARPAYSVVSAVPSVERVEPGRAAPAARARRGAAPPAAADQHVEVLAHGVGVQPDAREPGRPASVGSGWSRSISRIAAAESDSGRAPAPARGPSGDVTEDIRPLLFFTVSIVVKR